MNPNDLPDDWKTVLAVWIVLVLGAMYVAAHVVVSVLRGVGVVA